MELTSSVVIFVRVWSAFGGGLTLCTTTGQIGWIGPHMILLTVTTAAVGPFLAPCVTASQRSSRIERFAPSISSSHDIANNGESQRAIDDGSSKRMIRLSKLDG
jgi:hypothetical protein